MRFIASLLLLLLVGLAGAATTTTVNCKTGGDTPLNKVTQAAVNATENIIVVQVTPGTRVTVEFKCTADWYYRSAVNTDGTGTHDTTTQDGVTALVPLRLAFTETTTFYHVRQSADGTMTIKPLKIEANK